EGVTFRWARVLEGAVANQFAIQSAVHAVVDFFEEDSVKTRVDCRPGTRGVNRDAGDFAQQNSGATVNQKKSQAGKGESFVHGARRLQSLAGCISHRSRRLTPAPGPAFA